MSSLCSTDDKQSGLKLTDNRYVEIIKYEGFLIIKSELVAQIYSNMSSDNLILVSSNIVSTNMNINAPDVVIQDNGEYDKYYNIPVNVIYDSSGYSKSINIRYELHRLLSEEFLIVDGMSISLRQFKTTHYGKDTLVFNPTD